jgi:hypothetical protein
MSSMERIYQIDQILGARPFSDARICWSVSASPGRR